MNQFTWQVLGISVLIGLLMGFMNYVEMGPMGWLFALIGPVLGTLVCLMLRWSKP